MATDKINPWTVLGWLFLGSIAASILFRPRVRIQLPASKGGGSISG